MNVKKKWYAVYTRHRWEKKVNQMLLDKGLECYCPMNKVHRKWSDRLKIIHEPLFKSYVFVRIGEEEKAVVRMTNGVVNFVYWLGKPAVVKDREIELIKKFLNEHDNIEVENLHLEPNTRVEITSGIFMNKQATVLRSSRSLVKVLIDSIGFALIAYIDRSKIGKSSKQYK